MQEAIRSPSNYIHGEEWVLGKAAIKEIDPAILQEKLAERYHQEFIDEWRKVLQKSRVAPYRDLGDAERKLDRLTSPSSPLLELLWFVSTNTKVDAPDVSNHFQSVQAVEEPGTPGKPPDHFDTAIEQAVH